MRIFAAVALLLCASGAYAKDMSGWYAGLSGAVGDSTGLRFNSYELEPTTDRFGVFGGYDSYSGDWLQGIEGAVETETRSSRRFGEFATPPGAPTQLRFDFSSSYREIVTPTVSIRLGRRFGQFLAYGRLGAGLAVVNVANDSGPDCSKPNDNGYIAGCDFSFDGVGLNFSDTKILPTANIGLGAQHDFGRAFIRSEIQVRRIFTSGADWTFTDQATQKLGSFAVGCGSNMPPRPTESRT